MKAVRKIANIFDLIESIFAIVAGILIVFIIFAVTYEVVMRYFLGRPTIWALEVTRFTLLYITFLGGAWVLKKEGHVNIDLALNRLTPRIQALLNSITSIIGAAACLILTWQGAQVTLNSFQIGYRMETELRTPQFLVLAIIPLGSLLFCAEFLRRSYSQLLKWRALSGSNMADK